MTPTELAAVIEDHRLWLAGKGGKRANLRYANLRYAILVGADLRYANLRRADLYGADLRRADLVGADLRYANLYDANLRHADLRYANLYGANLRHADLRRADLYGADLRYANLRRADLYGADLRRAILVGADLRYANLYDANLRHADLRYANLYGANLSGAILDETAGIAWARSGPCGIGPREILGWWTPAEGLVIEAGCFRGSPAEMRAQVAAGGWDWPEADRDRLAASVEKHLARVEGDVTEWLAACGGAA